MKILIFGGNGMLGHQLYKFLSAKHDVRITLRQPFSIYNELGVFVKGHVYPKIDVRLMSSVEKVLSDFHPEVVINAVGIIKQRSMARESIACIEINSLFPHKLALACRKIDARLIHLSTDCVFSGKKGNYNESDEPDATDVYGRSKLLGEVRYDNCLTLRTSMVGRELTEKKSLLEWFLSQHGHVSGYKNAIFSGFTTLEISRVIEKIIVDFPQKNGLYHVSSKPISKYELLKLFKTQFKIGIEILPDTTFCCDRSLDSSRFCKDFQYNPPSWEKMIAELN